MNILRGVILRNFGLTIDAILSGSTSGLTPARVKYFFDLGLFAEAEFIANALIDEAVNQLTESNIKAADSIVSELLTIGIKLKHINYVKALCLIEQNQIASSQKFLEAELLFDPNNQEASDILSQVLEASNEPKSRLLVGPVPYQKLVDCITSEASREKNDRNLFILIQPLDPRGEYLGQFEQECNQVITAKDAWSYVKLIRGRMPQALDVYKLAGSDRLGD